MNLAALLLSARLRRTLVRSLILFGIKNNYGHDH